MQNSTAVMLFTDDLRLDDNPALLAASQHEQLLCVYVFDELKLRKEFGLDAIGPFRARFIWQSLTQLNSNLKCLGQQLLILKGNLYETLQQIQQQRGEICVYRQQPSTWYEVNQVQALCGHFAIHLIGAPTLLDADCLPFELAEMPESFTPFRKKTEAHWPDIAPLPKPSTLPAMPQHSIDNLNTCPLPCQFVEESRAVLDFKGGEESGEQRLMDYIWKRRALSHYKQSRNQMLGSDYSSKFSPWLAQGCLSPRRIYQQVREYEARFGANESSYWLIFELLWRDFFHFQAQKLGKDFFPPDHRQTALANTGHDNPGIINWCQGKTGNDFVDANMRELLLTGFISNRGRQNVASYLIHDLQLDWRSGAAWFEHQLIDYDAASNYGNWCYIAGLAHDPRKGRHFNIDAQAQRYDPGRQYRDYWLNNSS
jgi:deoxyribodipyrimidine photo-lyase